MNSSSFGSSPGGGGAGGGAAANLSQMFAIFTICSNNTLGSEQALLLSHPSFYRIQPMVGVHRLPPIPPEVFGTGALDDFHAAGGVVLPYDGLDYGEEAIFNLARLVRLCAPPGMRLDWPQDLLRSVSPCDILLDSNAMHPVCYN